MGPSSGVNRSGGSPTQQGRLRVLKLVVVCYRRGGWSRERFRQYFREVHGPLAVAIPHVARYVQNFVEPDEIEGDPPWDAVIEFWFADRAAYDAAWASPEGQRAAGDNPNCMDMARTAWGLVDEVVVRG
jgi:uncharacterized protein (TIGR02118 family)